MPLREFVRLDHDAVPAIVAVQPGTLAEPDKHRQVGLLPGVVFREVMPAHAGDGGALRRTWKAARAGSARLKPPLYLCARAPKSSAPVHKDRSGMWPTV